MGGSAFYGLGAFFAPIQDEFGWSYATVSWAFAVQTVVMGLVAPVVGWAFDRWGPRVVCVAGVALAALSFAGLSRIDSPFALLLAFSGMGLGASAATYLLLNSVVSLWFHRRLGLAMAMVQTGYGIGGLMALAFVLLIEDVGWRAAALWIGVAVLVLGTPMALILRHRPETHGLLPDGALSIAEDQDQSRRSRPRRARPHLRMVDYSVARAVRTSAFWLILVILALSTAVTMVVFTHQIRALITYGITPQVAGTVAGLAALVGLLGRYGMGWLSGLVSSRHLLPVALLMQAAGVFVLSRIEPSSSLEVVLFVTLFGMGQGGIFLLSPLIQKEYFGTKAFGAIQGLLIGPSMLVTAIAPVVVGRLVDRYGTYRPMFAVSGAIGLGLVVLMLFSRPPSDVREAVSLDAVGDGAALGTGTQG